MELKQQFLNHIRQFERGRGLLWRPVATGYVLNLSNRAQKSYTQEAPLVATAWNMGYTFLYLISDNRLHTSSLFAGFCTVRLGTIQETLKLQTRLIQEHSRDVQYI